MSSSLAAAPLLNVIVVADLLAVLGQLSTFSLMSLDSMSRHTLSNTCSYNTVYVEHHGVQPTGCMDNKAEPFCVVPR